MNDQELREALRLLLQVWEHHGQHACEALLEENLVQALLEQNNEGG